MQKSSSLGVQKLFYPMVAAYVNSGEQRKARRHHFPLQSQASEHQDETSGCLTAKALVSPLYTAHALQRV